MVLLLVVTACGGSGETGTQISLDGGETAAGPSNYGSALAGEDITSEAPTLAVKAGENITITLENTHGQYSRTSGLHDLVIVPKLDDLQQLIASGKVVNAQTGEVIDHVLWGGGNSEAAVG